MPVTRRYLCPDCEHEFNFLHLNREEPPPEYCPACGGYMGTEPRVMPGAPAIGTWKGKTVDRTYDMIVEGGEIRAALTDDPSQKITNLKDNLREGDVAAMVPQPSKQYQEAVQATGMANQNWGMVAPGGVSTAAVIQMAQAGRQEGSGAQVMQAIQQGNDLLAPIKRGEIKPSWGGG